VTPVSLQVILGHKNMDANYAEPAVTPNTILEILNKLGLTKNESKVYAYLSKNGPTKAKIITQN